MLLVAVARNRQECVLNAIESQSLLEREKKDPHQELKSRFFSVLSDLSRAFRLYKKKMLRVDQLVSDKTRMCCFFDRHPSLISQLQAQSAEK